MSIKGALRNPGSFYLAFSACSRKPGAVDSDFSISVAHIAAPTVFVYANAKDANGIISKTKAATPKL